jgi:hypothetical protein
LISVGEARCRRLLGRPRRAQRVQGRQQVVEVVAAQGRYRQRVAETELVEGRGGLAPGPSLGLVDDEQHGLAGAPHQIDDGGVLGDRAGPAVDHQGHGIGLADGERHLLRHLARQRRGFAGQAAGVDDDGGALRPRRVAVQPVPRQAGIVGHQRVAGARQGVEQRRLADVGTADDGKDRQGHGQRRSRGR